MTDKLRFKNENSENYPDWEKTTIDKVSIYEPSNIYISDLDYFNGVEIYDIYDAKGIIRKIDYFKQESEYISIVKDGSGVGRLNLCKPKTSITSTLGYIKEYNIHIRFLYYALNRLNYKKYIIGETIPHLYYKDYCKEIILKPCIQEQQKIADFLSTIDDKIENQKEIVKNLEEVKKGLLQKIFSQEIRFKSDNGLDYPEWEEKKLGDIGAFYNGLSGKNKNDFNYGNKKYITYMSVFNDVIINLDSLGLVNVSDNEKQNKVLKGDILFTQSSETVEEVGMCSTFLGDGIVYLNSFCFGFRLNSNKDNNSILITYLLRTPDIRHKIIREGQGSTRYNLSSNRLVNLTLNLPQKEEQQKIADVLSTIDKKIEKEKNILDNWVEIKKGLLQRIFMEEE